VELELDLAHLLRVLAAPLHEVLDLDLLERSPTVPIQSPSKSGKPIRRRVGRMAGYGTKRNCLGAHGISGAEG
jgi:hypothetical protein